MLFWFTIGLVQLLLVYRFMQTLCPRRRQYTYIHTDTQVWVFKKISSDTHANCMSVGRKPATHVPFLLSFLFLPFFPLHQQTLHRSGKLWRKAADKMCIRAASIYFKSGNLRLTKVEERKKKPPFAQATTSYNIF